MISILNSLPNLNIITIRIVSFLILILGSIYLSESRYNFIFFSILFGHYFLQYIYTKSFIKYLLPDQFTKKSLFMLIGRWFFLMTMAYLFLISPLFQITLTFGIHFVFTEVYAESYYVKNSLSRISHFFTAGSIYSYYMYDISPFNYLNKSIYVSIFICGITGFILNDLLRKRKKITIETVSIIFYELLGFFFVSIFPARSNKLINIIFYHLLWWVLYPIFKRNSNLFTATKIKKYLLTSLFVTGVIGFLFTLNKNFLFDYIQINGRIFGSLHIISTFFLSSLNPDIINFLFLKKQKI